MNPRTKRRGGLLVAPALAGCLLAGCDDGSRADDDGQARSAQAQVRRARQVADAWRGSAAVAVWRRGYFPMAAAVRTPASGRHSRADRQAYDSGNFALPGGLPAATAERGKDDGPVVGALETDEGVVLYVSVKGARDGACTADLIEQDVEVGLRRPLGARVLLDAFTGRPVPSADR
ncbi:hypothetical protein ACIRBZ_01350 [Streptomyces sp. NPDC094038]|uniref:hypothetical protein n=1 Tax=Streptomyces sp. NPDC094038 TaxID=3366055 RepID=UPI0037F82D04